MDVERWVGEDERRVSARERRVFDRSSLAHRGLFHERHVAPSILSANFARLGSQVAELMDVGARVIHVDVMDGHFVPPITMGPMVVSALADRLHSAGGILDVHLMIERPERQIEAFARAGADGITVHVEATEHLHYTLATIREHGCNAGAAICPATAAGALDEVVAAGTLDLALCMSVNPGWGGQRFIESSPDKLARLRAALPDRVALEVDGGINTETLAACVDAGANLLVAGSAVFGSADPTAAFAALSAAAGNAR